MRPAFVRSMLFEGRLRIGALPRLALTDEDLATLKRALAIETLHLPGPPLHGSLPTLIHAVQVMYRLAWRFFNQDPVGPADDPALRMPAPPRTPEEHAGSDVAFRFLAGLYKRAVSRDAEDPLVLAMKNLLRQWPLSGVLADVTEAPAMPIDFGGHVGLGFLFAQRLAENERSCWVPSGPARDCVEVVYQALGRSLVEAPVAVTGAR